MLASDNTERSSSSSSSSGSNIWEIEGITINLDEVSINDEEFNIELRRIKTNSTGGLGIEQTAGALKMKLRDREDVYVVYDKEICGRAELDNSRIANQVNRLVLAQKYVVFPYAINEEHQVSIVINMEEKKLVVTDSLGASRRDNTHLKELARQLEIENIIDGVSNYNTQRNNWECGVHAFFNTVDVINNKRANNKEDLELDNNLKVILEHALRYRVVEGKLQAKREEHRTEKTRLLEAIESLRDSEGNFKNSNPEDDLKILADVLQMEIWGNLDRREPTSHSGRSLTQEERIRERKIEELIEQYERDHSEDMLGIIILNVLKRGGQYNEVIKYHRNALQNRNLGFENIKEGDTEVIKLYKLASVFFRLDKYDKALSYEFERLKQSKHPLELASCYNSLGSIFAAKCEYVRAMEYTKKDEAIVVKHLGEKSFHLGLIYRNIGQGLCLQAEYGKALEYYNKALIILENNGNAMLQIADLYSRIGNILHYQDKQADALRLYEKALKILEDYFGNDHPDVASIYNAIGNVYKAFLELDKALYFYNKALVIWKKVYGNEYSETTTSYNNIGIVLCEQGKYNEALENHLQALSIRKSLFGEMHIYTANSYNNIGKIYYKQKQYDEALKYHKKALSIFQEIYETKGYKHHYLTTSYNDIGNIYAVKGQYNEALANFNEAKKIAKEGYGKESFFTATTYCCIAKMFERQSDYNKTLIFYMKAMTILEKLYASDHPDVSALYIKVAKTLIEVGHPIKALVLLIQKLQKIKNECGIVSQSAANMYFEVGGILCLCDMYDKALLFFEKVIQIENKLYRIENSNHSDLFKVIEVIKEKIRMNESLSNEGNIQELILTIIENALNNLIIDGKQDAEVTSSTTEQKASSNGSLTHTLLMKKFQKELKVSWDDVYFGIAVEQAMVGMAGIETRQTGAQYRPSTNNGVITTTFKLRFVSAEELNNFVNYYNQRFPELIVGERPRFQAGGRTTIEMDTRILHHEVARSLGEYVARERSQATSIREQNSSREQSGCCIS